MHISHTQLNVWWQPLFFFFVCVLSGAQALASVTQCVNWQRCWATWSLAHWWASLKPFPSCWHRLCWLAVGWWGSDCQTHVPMSSCKPHCRTMCYLPGFHSISWITNHLWTRFCLNICLLSPPPYIYSLINNCGICSQTQTQDERLLFAFFFFRVKHLVNNLI